MEVLLKDEERGLTLEAHQDLCPTNPRLEYGGEFTEIIFSRDHEGFVAKCDHKAVDEKEYRDLKKYSYFQIDASELAYQRWGSGAEAFIRIDKDKFLKDFGLKAWDKKAKERAKEVLEGIIKEYRDYLEGECYGYRIVDQSGNELDSCWGFIGREHFEESAKEAFKAIQESTPVLVKMPGKVYKMEIFL